VAVERELKFAVPADGAVPELVGAGPVASVEPLPAVELDAQYWDTEAFELLAVGATVRRRTGESTTPRWTVKIPAGPSGTGALLSRRELDVDDPADLPPGAVLDALAGRVTGELVRVARLRTTRRRSVLRDAAGVALAELDDDVVDATGPGRDPVTFREIEVELTADAPAELVEAVTAAFASVGATGVDPRPKLAQFLDPR
jgi:inorganic triphosphatase YgiF